MRNLTFSSPKTTLTHSKLYLAYPIMREPNTDPIPAPDPATPTVAAPAPMNLAAESMSRLAGKRRKYNYVHCAGAPV